ncbi:MULTISPECIES: RNA polymerase sigma factor [unclassified Brevundimonas]|uniref:RNA polymerase sigma factor n=1 Tax=unclassified Brevundimonas TaxID=2622653 RepID=UPI0025C40F13|nr:MULTISPECIES: RNA polymerase sigma factor [unclassified Brevundimonas]
MTSQDIRWLAEAQNGSDLAYGRLVASHQAMVRGFLRRMLGGGWADADDVAQEVFVHAWQGLYAVRHPERFRSWLIGMAWRRAQDHIRSNQRRARRDQDWLQSLSVPAGVTQEDRLAMEQAMRSLAPEARACAALSLAEGWTHEEISQALTIPIGTVKSHISRSRERLVAALGG